MTVQEQRTWFLPFMFVLALKAGSDGTQLQFDAVSVTTTALIIYYDTIPANGEQSLPNR